MKIINAGNLLVAKKADGCQLEAAVVALAAGILPVVVVGHEVDEAQAVAQLRRERAYPVAHPAIQARVEVAEGEHKRGPKVTVGPAQPMIRGPARPR